MTEEEKLAEEYIKKNNLEWELECHRTSPIGEVKQSFLAGLKAQIKWHKVADELPPTDEFISDYVITDKGVATYNSRLNIWYLHEIHKWVNDITAWCEIPQFKE